MNQNPVLELLVATRNRGKILEIREALSDLPIKLRCLEDFSSVTPVDEVGKTYRENATLKALGYSKQTGIWAVGDDSGLEVDALGGRPGVFSARFGGGGASDYDRTEKLLTMLSQFPDPERTARFVCCVALARCPQDDQHRRDAEPQVSNVAEGKCEGRIAMGPRGSNGFGFDPIFLPDGYNMTFSELPSRVKNKISHRAKALKATRDFLEQLLAQT